MQINLVVNTILATGQGPGAVSWLTYAFRLMYLPIGVVGVSIATVALPVMARHAALNEFDRMRQTISRGLRLMLMLMVPATIGLIVMSEPIVRLIFERGRFTPADTQATALALVCYAPGIVGYSVVRFVVPSFYALGTSLTPAFVSVGSVGLNIVLNLILVRVLGYQGLALGTSIAALTSAAVLLMLLRERLNGLEGTKLADSFIRITVAAALMGAAVWQVDQWCMGWWPTPIFLTQIVIVSGEIGVGLAVLGASARLLRIAEFNQALSQVVGRFRRLR
jgi:putative peptidoglycan lipid II flippase